MEIAIRSRRVKWNEDLRQQVERSIEFAVDRHKSRIDRILVYVTDLNGPRGGADKLCQITAELRGTRPVLILERGEDLVAVINRATERLGYRIGGNIHGRRTSGTRGYRATIRAA